MLNKVKWGSAVGAVLAAITAITGIVFPPGLEGGIVVIVMAIVAFYKRESAAKLGKLKTVK